MDNKMNTRIIIVGTILGIFVCNVWADGPKNDSKTNRYTGGPKIVLSLTAAQLKFLAVKHSSFVERLLLLTDDQQKKINDKWGVKITKVDVWETRKGQWDCSCHAANAAFRFDENHIEIGKKFVATDEYAEKVWRAEATLPEPGKK